MSNFVRKPFIRAGKWVVVIAESRSPIAEVIEIITCTGEEDARNTYRRIKKQKGAWL